MCQGFKANELTSRYDERRENIICMDPAMLLNADVKSDLVHNTHYIHLI